MWASLNCEVKHTEHVGVGVCVLYKVIGHAAAFYITMPISDWGKCKAVCRTVYIYILYIQYKLFNMCVCLCACGLEVGGHSSRDQKGGLLYVLTEGTGSVLTSSQDQKGSEIRRLI